MKDQQRYLDWREALAVLGAEAGLAVTCSAEAAGPAENAVLGENQAVADTVLWYAQPAASWVEALPVGAGRISAMVHGGTDREYLQLNEDTLWSGGPYDPASPEALQALPTARQLIFEGNYEAAEALIRDGIMARPLRQMPYSTMGHLVISRLGQNLLRATGQFVAQHAKLGPA